MSDFDLKLNSNEKMHIDFVPNQHGKFYHAIQSGGLIHPYVFQATKHRPLKNTNSKNVVVYNVWAGDYTDLDFAKYYITYIQYSIMSQILYTDIREKSDIFVFVSSTHHHMASYFLRELLDESQIISVSNNFSYKYLTATHPILRKYNSISFVDSDLFFYNKGGKDNLYSRITESFETDNDKILLIPETHRNFKDCFNDRHAAIKTHLSLTEYEIFQLQNLNLTSTELNNLFKNEHWWLSGFSVFNQQTFINSNNSNKANYYKYSMLSSYLNNWCDETVWLMWSHANKKNIMDVTKELKINFTLEFDGTFGGYGNSLNCIHPIIYSTFLNINPLILLNKIKSEYEK